MVYIRMWLDFFPRNMSNAWVIFNNVFSPCHCWCSWLRNSVKEKNKITWITLCSWIIWLLNLSLHTVVKPGEYICGNFCPHHNHSSKKKAWEGSTPSGPEGRPHSWRMNYLNCTQMPSYEKMALKNFLILSPLSGIHTLYYTQTGKPSA